MAKKEEKTKLVWNPEAVAAGQTIKAGAKTVGQGWKTILQKTGVIKPNPQDQLAKLQAEVAALEQKKAMEKQIAELKEKKASLEAEKEEGNGNYSKEEKEAIA